MNKKNVGVLDYGAGNLKSVETALKFIKTQFFIIHNPDDFKKADALIFPGVGDARAAMNVLNQSGLGQALRHFHAQGNPILGICLGCQIVLSHSEEGDTDCLDLIRGTVSRFPYSPGVKVPHMGWNQVSYPYKHPVFKGIPENSSFYFVHSYYPKPEDSNHIIGQTDYHIGFCSGMAYKNIIAFQFHPEKSGKMGLRLLSNFLTWEP